MSIDDLIDYVENERVIIIYVHGKSVGHFYCIFITFASCTAKKQTVIFCG